jgi:hypothetical protein
MLRFFYVFPKIQHFKKKIGETNKKIIFVCPMTSSSISLEGFHVNASGLLVTVFIIGIT